MVQRWLDWRKKTPWEIWVAPDGQWAREMEVTEPIGGELFKSFVDVVFATDGDNGRPIVVDIKTGARPQSDNLQLGIYKCGIEAKFPGVRVFGGSYWDARKGELTGVVSLDQFTPQYVATLARRRKLAHAAGLFIPNVGPMCKSCSVGRFCAINGGSEAAKFDPDYGLMG